MEKNSSKTCDACTLYIPFWLYSNAGEERRNQRGCSFTFHSGYIPIVIEFCHICSGISLHSILVIFQWFYQVYSDRGKMALHSILVIFQFVDSQTVAAVGDSLHSILVIFQSLSYTIAYWFETTFTFHSGYIPIKGKDGYFRAKVLYIPFWLYSNHIQSL